MSLLNMKVMTKQIQTKLDQLMTSKTLRKISSLEMKMSQDLVSTKKDRTNSYVSKLQMAPSLTGLPIT